MSYPIFLPLIFILAGLLIALVYGFQSINKRIPLLAVTWLLSLFPLAAFITLLHASLMIQNGSGISWQIEWLQLAGFKGSLYYDSLSAVFALLVTGIGTLVVIYSGYYFKGERSSWRFLSSPDAIYVCHARFITGWKFDLIVHFLGDHQRGLFSTGSLQNQI